MAQQRALKQQKNLLQQALVFDARAKQLQDWPQQKVKFKVFLGELFYAT